MPLPAGMLTIGDADSDIAVTLEHGARVTLSVDDDGVRLLTAAPLWVDGVPVASPDDNWCDDGDGDGAAARPPSAPDTSCLPLHAVIDLAGMAFRLDDGSDPTPCPMPPRPARRPAAPRSLASSPKPQVARRSLASPDARAAASLRSALWRCPTAGERPVVRSTLTHLALDPELRVDLQTMSARAHELLALPSLDAGGVDVGTELPPFADDVLVGWYDEWVVAERERFRQLRLHALDQIGELLLRSRRYSEAVEVGLVAVSSEPLRESAHRLLVRAHLCEGNLAEALRQYRSYADLLSRELGVRPSAAMEELVSDALASASSPRWVKPRVPGRLAPTVTA